MLSTFHQYHIGHLKTWRGGELIFWCHGFSWPESWSRQPFPPPVDHILSELFTMTSLAWVALHSLTHSCIELNKSLLLDKTVIHDGESKRVLPQKTWTQDFNSSLTSLILLSLEGNRFWTRKGIMFWIEMLIMNSPEEPSLVILSLGQEEKGMTENEMVG